jgi:hypothetical protein
MKHYACKSEPCGAIITGGELEIREERISVRETETSAGGSLFKLVAQPPLAQASGEAVLAEEELAIGLRSGR